MMNDTDLKKILIAEDDPFLAKIVKSSLKGQGFIVENAKNGEEALSKIREGGYSLILLDLVMPAMNGFEVLQQLKNDGILIPVLVFTSLAQDEDREEVLRLGAKGYYVKHQMTIDELSAIITRELE